MAPSKVIDNGERSYSEAEIHPKGYPPGSEPTISASDNTYGKPSGTGTFLSPPRSGDSVSQPGQQFRPFSGSFIPPGFPKNGWCGMFLHSHFSTRFLQNLLYQISLNH